MDTERLDRFDRYFELMQQQFVQMLGQMAALQEQVTTLQVDVKGLQAGQVSINDRLDTLNRSVNERFESTAEQIRTLTARVERVDARLDDGFVVFRRLDERFHAFEHTLIMTGGRVDTLADDIRQRFRVVTERLTAIEKRTAA